jgi:hypothetical protein
VAVVRRDEEAHRFGAHTLEMQEPLGIGEEITVLLSLSPMCMFTMRRRRGAAMFAGASSLSSLSL